MSSGIKSSSISCRMKSKSGWLADGNPTSISLKPIATTASNMRRLRTGSIGAMRAWLPSRRSTEHHRGAWSMTRSGQVRSASRIGTNGSYLSNGMVGGVTGVGGIAAVPRFRREGEGVVETTAGAKNEEPPGRGGRGAGERDELALALRKQEEAGAAHRSQPIAPRWALPRADARVTHDGRSRTGTLTATMTEAS